MNHRPDEFAEIQEYKDYNEVLKNAARRDGEHNEEIEARMNDAHGIIDAYKAGSIDYETCISYLMKKCHRSREVAIMNIQARDIWGGPGYGEKSKSTNRSKSIW